MRDGGRWALAGYFYQIVGAIGWKARACSHWSGETSDSDELKGTLEVMRNAELSLESFGQDVVAFNERCESLGFRERDECVLVQFKFSRRSDRRNITPKVLQDILKQLKASEQQVRNHGLNVTGYVLATNRQLSNPAEKHAAMQPELRVVKTRLDEWEEALKSFARRFGLTDEEIEDGINKLVGDLFRQIGRGENAWVTKKRLVKAFTGYEDAYPLIPEYVNQISYKHLQDFKNQLGLHGEPVRRPILDEITKAISEQRALLILHGLGGCGKTVTLWQWAQDLVKTYSQTNGAFTVIRLANDIPRFWIADITCRWGCMSNHPSRSSEPPERVLGRLHLANPSVSPPIMHLGLDGLDEKIGNTDREDFIKETLRWFWEEDKASRQELRPPRAILIVTCRDAEDLIQEWLQLDMSGFGPYGPLPEKISVGDFSLEELRMAARTSLLDELYLRIERTLQLIEGYEPYRQIVGLSFGTETPFVPTVNEQVLEALKHPAMWRSFLGLSFEVQAEVLDGDFHAVQQMAENFIKWFHTKTRRRSPGREWKYLLQVLPKIAYHCQNNTQTQQSRTRDWIEPACKNKSISEREADFFYNEALLAGIIQEDDRKHWRWRHGLVLEYLATLKGV